MSFPRKKIIAGPHLSYIRKLKMSRVSIHERTETQNLPISQMGLTWRLPAPTRSSWQQSLWWLDYSPAKCTMNKLPDKTHTLTYELCPSVVCRWKPESLKFCSEVNLFIFYSSLSRNCFFFSLCWIKVYSSLLSLRLISEDPAAAVHLTSPLNPINSLTDAPLNAKSN